MHEMSIIKSVLEAVSAEMEGRGLERLKKVRLRIGELTAVEPETLKFCFEAAIKSTPMEGASLEIEEVPLTGRCAGCGAEFRFTGFESVCPECRGTAVTRLTGTELDLVSMEAD